MNPEVKSLRANFYMGFYENVIREAKEMKSSQSTPDVDVYFYRALLEISPGKVASSISSQAPTALQAIKQLATYRTAPAETKELVLETLSEWLRDTTMRANVTLQLVACEIYLQEENYGEALALLHGDRENLDKLAMCAQIYLKLDRPDLAQKIVETMLGVEEDDCLTLLSSAWVAVAHGQETKIEQAQLNLEELIERWGPSVVVNNALASCMMLLRNWTEAFRYLKLARETARKQNMVTPAETLMNTAVCLQHMNKPQFIPNINAELETNHPRHACHQAQKEMEQAFTKCAANYSS